MKGSSLLQAASGAVTKISALVATFFLFPPVFNGTVLFVEDFVRQNYGYDLVSIARIGWMILSALGIFTVVQFIIAFAIGLAPFLFASNR